MDPGQVLVSDAIVMELDCHAMMRNLIEGLPKSNKIASKGYRLSIPDARSCKVVMNSVRKRADNHSESCCFPEIYLDNYVPYVP